MNLLCSMSLDRLCLNVLIDDEDTVCSLRAFQDLIVLVEKSASSVQWVPEL